jgi:hypothetical protein
VESEAAGFFLAGLMVILVHFFLPLTVLQTSFVLAAA